MLDGLQRALTEPGGLPLVSTKAGLGLFPAGAAGKQAATAAREQNLVALLATETRGKVVVERYGLTEKGLAHLLASVSPRPVLESLLQAMDGCQAKVDAWIAETERNRTALAGLKSLAERVLAQLQKPEATLPPWARNGHGHDPKADVVAKLSAWRAGGQVGDCPLPDLYASLREKHPKLSVGAFHDALRILHDERKIYLHPWTGPLYQLPQPALSLLVGHEIAYYASPRE